ncbi:phosphatase PAP2 family protein [Burkholderia alba]|uniref:phosphatase PAP2 family protein n=1 Tax=Burkholderia alba TaxID=2683677 RepID=UPI002B0551B9|nr:phosphatase PAP2 family protein [Burkholderia alba]
MAWRDARRSVPASYPYWCGWGVVAAVFVVDIAWLDASGDAVRWDGALAVAQVIAICVGLGGALCGVARIPRYRDLAVQFRYHEVAETLFALALLATFVSVTSVLSYLCVTLDPPLIDAALLRTDARLGFDWPAAYAWGRAHASVRAGFAFAYDSAKWQLIGVTVLLGVTGRRAALREFVWLFMASCLLAVAISAPFPAASAFVHFGVTDPNTADTVSDFALLRHGGLRVFDLAALQGLVSMPSFHAVMGVLFAYALRRVPVLSVAALGLNALMIVSTPTQGGHYLIDVIAGLLLAAVVIGGSRWVRGETMWRGRRRLGG